MAVPQTKRPVTISMPVDEFFKATGLKSTQGYELFNTGEVDTFTVGRKRLVVLDSWYRYIERNRGTPAKAPARSPPRPNQSVQG
jgi:hypothetical protein